MSTATRATLLERLRDGTDALVWDEFFARYWPTIYRVARRRGCSQHTAEEVVQDVMLQVFRQRDVYRYDPLRGRFRDWLHAVVQNKVAEHRRRPANRVQAVGGETVVMAQIADDAEEDAAWEAAFEQNLLVTLLDAVRRETSARTYLAFELVSLEGMSGSQAARIVGLSRNAVYKACKRVMERLVELGAPYRENGRLTAEIKQAMADRPPAQGTRSVTERIQRTMCEG
jgi:RNA polymerase sigma factor (sigma-70 family)